MAIRRRLTARFVKRLVVVCVLAAVFRLGWVSMNDVWYQEIDKSAHTIKEPAKGIIIKAKRRHNDVTIIPEFQKIVVTSKPRKDICRKIVPFRSVSPRTISTFDLPDLTDYSLDDSRNYKLPEEVYNRSKLPLGEEIRVIIVPFSHADPGYGLTVEDYYTQYTRNILTLMIDKLTQYPNMTFQWAETVFLERWFQDINDQQKQKVRSLIERGQLEIVLGGWVMPDEAITRYTSVVDQLIEGHQWVKENLGVKPESAWVNDPFGFSSTMPYLWKSTGIQNLVILRIHQAIKATLMKSKSLEFNWRPYWTSDADQDILTNIMPYTNYWASDVCGPVQKICRMFNFLHMQDDQGFVWQITDGNVQQIATEMYEAYKLTASIYEYNHLIIFLGEDNSYWQESSWDNTYVNYNKLMDYINNNPNMKMNIKFGTMKEYFANIRQVEAGKDINAVKSHPKFPVLSGDFFPYSDREDAYWTGYYTTRPWVKKLSREVEQVLRAADVFSVFLYHSCIKTNTCRMVVSGLRKVLDNLRTARRELGVYQHHDGITGTSVPYVVYDYELRLMTALERAQESLKIALVSMLTQGKSVNPNKLEESFIKLDPKSIKSGRLFRLKNGKITFIVSNPLEKSRYEIINILIDKPNIVVVKGNKTVPFQVSKISHGISGNELGYFVSIRTKVAPFEIQELVIKEKSITKRKVCSEKLVANAGKVTIENTKLKATVDASTCKLQSITDSKGRETAITSQFLHYRSHASGAYLFGPAGPATDIPGLHDNVKIYVTKGPLMSEINCIYPMGFSQRFRVYNVTGSQGHGLHISHVVDLDKGLQATNNIEVILRLQTDINNDNIFFTDQNSFQLMGRKTYPDRPIETNYYPISSMAMLEDDNKRLTLHSAQPAGVASLEAGWLEVMLDRNMDTDDGRGLGSGIFDKVSSLSEFVLQVEYKTSESSLEEERYTHPTLQNILVNDLLQYPTQIFGVVQSDVNYNIIKTGDAGVIASQNIVHNNINVNNDAAVLNSHNIPKHSEIQLPCDTNFVNTRLLVTNDLNIVGTSIVLHRKPVHCLYDHRLKKCVSRDRPVSPNDLLEILGVSQGDTSKTLLLETSLSHLHFKSDAQMISDVRPDVSELRTFLVKYNEI